MFKDGIFLFAFLSLMTACGGGGSDSGGGMAANIVSSCLTVTTEPIDSPVSTQRVIFTNTCDFAVNLSTVFGVSLQGPFLLAPSEQRSSVTASATRFIACRPPSVGIDTDDSAAGVSLSCS